MRGSNEGRQGLLCRGNHDQYFDWQSRAASGLRAIGARARFPDLNSACSSRAGQKVESGLSDWTVHSILCWRFNPNPDPDPDSTLNLLTGDAMYNTEDDSGGAEGNVGVWRDRG